MAAYYNEIDPYAAQWLRNLIAAGHIAPGDVDERSIVDVQPDDLKGYTQAHFFAGIGVWSYAARLAGFPDERPVWTGSCPCQPLSKAGERRGADDERHLWPVWRNLIKECRPATVFGEQVSVGIARTWFDAVSSDFEEMGYAIGAIVSPAACFGAGHIRDRLWFVADAGSERPSRFIPDGDCAPSLVRSEEFQRRNPCVSARVFPRTDNASVWPINGSARCVGAIRAYGNAIVPQVAAEVIGAYMEAA